MIGVFIQRLVQGLLVLFVLFTLTFFLCKSLPYDAIQSEKAMPEQVQQKMRAYYNYDKPVISQYTLMLYNFAIKWDPGYSVRLEGRPVLDIIKQSFPVSFIIGTCSMVIALAVGIPIGVISAARRNTLWDFGLMAFAMIGLCVPSFVSGPLLAEFFGSHLRWLPAMGWESGRLDDLVLPVLTLSLGVAAYISRMTRAGMLDILSQDFIRTARAKGVSSSSILIKHCLRGGLVPVVAYIGPAYAGIIAGSVIIETVFQVPGLGSHYIKAIEVNDVGVILAIAVLFGALVVLGNILSDVLNAWLNPRARQSS